MLNPYGSILSFQLLPAFIPWWEDSGLQFLTDICTGISDNNFLNNSYSRRTDKSRRFHCPSCSVPDYMFELFGSPVMSEYAWYTILAMVLANLGFHYRSLDRNANCRFRQKWNDGKAGHDLGNVCKAIVNDNVGSGRAYSYRLYAGKLNDPDLIWGHMSHELLYREP